MKKYFLLLSIICVALTACRQPAHKGETEIVFLTTNDIHAHIDNFGKMAALVKEERGRHTNVYVVNNGDMFSGNPLVDNYPEKGYPVIDLMNRVGYDIATFGNHEFDYGQDVLTKRLQQAKFPFILANATMTAELPQTEAYKIVKLGNVTVAFLGLIQVDPRSGTPSCHPDRVKGITFDEPIQKALEYKYLRDKCDLFVVLSHLGADTDVKLAEAMPEIDVILGGHSHTRIDTGMIVNGVLITQTECWLKYAGKTTVTVKNGKVIAKHNKLINLAKYPKTDNEVQKVIDEYKSKDPGNVVIGKLVSDVKGKSELGALMTDAITEGLGLDIAFQNAGGVRVEELKKGDITINDVYTLDPFGNEVVKMEMTYDEMASLLRNSIRKGRNPYIDLIVSGISYTIQITGEGKIKDVLLYDLKTGKPLDKKTKYNVGMNSYIYSKYRFDHTDPGASLNVAASEVLIKYITEKKTIDYSKYQPRERIEIIK